MSFDSEDIMIIKFLIVGVILTLVGFYAFYRLLLRDRQENTGKSNHPDSKN